MNIFQYLGLPENHRKSSNKVTQYVKHWDEVTDKHKNGKEFVTQIKKDGVCALVVIDFGSARIFSRTGKPFTNLYCMEKQIDELKLADGVYMGELWLPKSVCSLEELSGMVNPNRVKPLDKVQNNKLRMLKLSLFDTVDVSEFVAGYSAKTYLARYNILRASYSEATFESPNSILNNWHPHIEVLVTTPANQMSLDGSLERAIYYGEEGIVIRDPNADWEAGHKGWRVMKMVRGVDYDLECVGYEEGTGKYKGKVANLIFKWKGGETIKCMLGKGWTHKDASDMFAAIEFTNIDIRDKHPADPRGEIFQVYALEESSKGKLRLPKVGELRFDKAYGDV